MGGGGGGAGLDHRVWILKEDEEAADREEGDWKAEV